MIRGCTRETATRWYKKCIHGGEKLAWEWRVYHNHTNRFCRTPRAQVGYSETADKVQYNQSTAETEIMTPRVRRMLDRVINRTGE